MSLAPDYLFYVSIEGGVATTLLRAPIGRTEPAARIAARALTDLLRLSRAPEPTGGRFVFGVGPDEPKRRKPTMPLQLTIDTESKRRVTLHPQTASGRPVEVDDVPTWQGDGTVQLEPSEDGMSCYIISSDEPSFSTITVSADADLGDGVETISDMIDVTIVHPRAKLLGLVADEPELKDQTGGEGGGEGGGGEGGGT